MKQVFLLGFVFMLNTILTFAQSPQGGRQRMTIEERAKRTTEWMKEELKLTDDQIAPIDSINLLFTKTQQVLFQAADGDREKVREAMAALEKEKENALAKVLTADQLKTYQEKSEEMIKRRGSGRNRRNR